MAGESKNAEVGKIDAAMARRPTVARPRPPMIFRHADRRPRPEHADPEDSRRHRPVAPPRPDLRQPHLPERLAQKGDQETEGQKAVRRLHPRQKPPVPRQHHIAEAQRGEADQ